jgi:NAD-dependent SIR2 family protein deacetylase
MADTARTKKEEAEFFDSEEEFKKKVKQLADMVRGSKHFIAFTGAGISTAAGIPDFRSGVDTVLDTGAGKWARDAAVKDGVDVKPAKRRVASTLKAIPTHTHMSFVKLCERGLLKAVISQNTDGLHRRSGLPVTHLAELHGNSNLETCPTCARGYLRDYRTRSRTRIDPKSGKERKLKVKEHHTGRFCSTRDCAAAMSTKGAKKVDFELRDTIINFGETLPEKELDFAERHSVSADVCIAMGSSLTVTPAADFPKGVGKRHYRSGDKLKGLVIVNLQKTPLDKYATLRINAKCDDVTRALMAELKIDVDEWRLRRAVRLSMLKLDRPPTSYKSSTAAEEDGTAAESERDDDVRWFDFEIAAVDSDLSTPMSLFKELTFVASVSSISKYYDCKFDRTKDLLPPKKFRMRVPLSADGASADREEKSAEKEEFSMKVSFFGHYFEPELELDLSQLIDYRTCEIPSYLTLELVYNPFTRSWEAINKIEDTTAAKGDDVDGVTEEVEKMGISSAASKE